MSTVGGDEGDVAAGTEVSKRFQDVVVHASMDDVDGLGGETLVLSA